MTGEELRKARTDLGFSRDHVARQLDPPVTGRTIQNWENGTAIKKWRLHQLAAIYGLEVEPNGVAA